MTKFEFEHGYDDAVNKVCLNCVMKTLDNPTVCETCPVRISYESLETQVNTK